MKFKYLFIALLALSSCSQEEMLETNDPSVQPDSKYPLTIEPFNMVIGGQTSRTTPNITPDKVSYTWNTGDEIGIFPFEGETPKGDQVYFSVTANAENASHATFDGGGWQIKEGMDYIAYYPFIDKFRMNPKAMEVSFAGQAVKGKNDYSNFGKYDFMVAAPQQQASVDGGMSFQFKHVAALCVIRFNLLYEMIHKTEYGYDQNGKLKRIDLIFPEEQKLFCETANMDLTKGLKALTATKKTHKISIDLTGYEFLIDDSNPSSRQMVIPFLLGPAELAGKTCEVNLETHSMKDELVGTFTTTLEFKKNLEGGNGYFLDLTFPDIDPANHHIHSHEGGSLTLNRIYKAMNGGNKLSLTGEIDFNDFELLRQAAGAPAKTTSRGTSNPVLTDLDLGGGEDESLYFLEEKTPGTDWYMNNIDFPSVVGTKLERLVLPGHGENLPAGIFNGVPLKTLEWYYSLRDYKITVDPNVFEGLKTEECDLKVRNDKGHMYQFISGDENGNMLFNGCKFKSIKEKITRQNPDTGDFYPPEYEDIKTTNVDAGAHSLDAICPGLIKAEDVTTALASGTTLKVTGKLSDRDLKTIAAYKTANITSLTFDNVGEYVPADKIFEATGFNNSANCDLVIPDTWKSKVSAGADGKVMFGGVAWKSIQTSTGIGFGGVTDEDVL